MSKQEAYAKLKRDVPVCHNNDASAPDWQLQKGIILDNIRAHGAQAIYDMLAKTTWPENCGSSPFDMTFGVALHMVDGTRPTGRYQGPSVVITNECLDELGAPKAEPVAEAPSFGPGR